MTAWLIFGWHNLIERIAQARERRLARAFQCASCEQQESEARRRERLQLLALFAQAGYFSMGYPVDVFQPAPDIDTLPDDAQDSA
jgi:hypothetical protein